MTEQEVEGAIRRLAVRIVQARRRESAFFDDDDLVKEESFRPGEYPYIPLHGWTAAKMLVGAKELFRKTRKRTPTSFLEVGCGLGGVTHSVQSTWRANALGIDIQASYVSFARKHMRGKFRRADALTFRDYRKFDIIYFYQPFSHLQLMQQFCNRLVEQAVGVVAGYFGLRDTVLGTAYSSPPYYGELDPPVLWDGASKQCMVVPYYD